MSPLVAVRTGSSDLEATGVLSVVVESLAPITFTARTANVYIVSLVRPVAVKFIVLASLPGISWKLVPPSLLYSYLVIGAMAELAVATSQLSAT